MPNLDRETSIGHKESIDHNQQKKINNRLLVPAMAGLLSVFPTSFGSINRNYKQKSILSDKEQVTRRQKNKQARKSRARNRKG